jgi:Ca2+-binding RTX toxin-like protein
MVRRVLHAVVAVCALAGALALPAGLSAAPGVRTSACTILGTQKADVLVGTNKADTICALGGSDRIRGRGGDDTIFGGPGADRIDGGKGRDVIYAAKGDDRIVGGRGHDLLRGGPGKDKLTSRDGIRDALWGGVGRDRARVDRVDHVRQVESVSRRR